jgi:diaminopimelate epimerase
MKRQINLQTLCLFGAFVLQVRISVYETLGEYNAIFDEREGSVVDEINRETFVYTAARRLKQVVKSIGFVQSASEDVLDDMIAAKQGSERDLAMSVRHFLKPSDADVILRVFGADGKERGVCCDATICAAAHFGLTPADKIRILTELNTEAPSVKTIEKLHSPDGYRVHMGELHWRDSEVPSVKTLFDSMEDLPIRLLRKSRFRFSDQLDPISFTAFAVHIGEPYLVIFVGEPQPWKYIIRDDMYSGFELGDSTSLDLGSSYFPYSRDILSEIGRYFNDGLDDRFPKGTNICIAQVKERNSIHYRVFDKGVNSEISSSGNAALACSSVGSYLGLTEPKECVYVVPHRISSVQGFVLGQDGVSPFSSSSSHRIRQTESGWSVEEPGRIVFRGELYLEM